MAAWGNVFISRLVSLMISNKISATPDSRPKARRALSVQGPKAPQAPSNIKIFVTKIYRIAGEKKKVWKCNIPVKCWVEDVLSAQYEMVWGSLGPCAHPGGNIERNITTYLTIFKMQNFLKYWAPGGNIVPSLEVILSAILLPTFVAFNFPSFYLKIPSLIAKNVTKRAPKKAPIRGCGDALGRVPSQPGGNIERNITTYLTIFKMQNFSTYWA